MNRRMMKRWRLIGWTTLLVVGVALGTMSAHSASAASYRFVNVVDDSGTFDNSSFGGATINNSGVVAFSGSQASVRGIYTGNGGPLTTIADTSGPFSDVSYAASINDNGVVAFSPSLDAGGSGIYIGSGGPTTPIIDSSGPFATFEPPAINNAGEVAFLGTRDDEVTGIFVTSGGPPTTIADLGGTGMQDFVSFNLPVINNSGTVAFMAFSTVGGGGGGSGIFSGSSDPVTTIKYAGFMGGFFDDPSINDSGTVVYVQHFANGQITLFGYSGGINTPLVTTSASGPIYNLTQPLINAAGDIAFIGTVAESPAGRDIYTGPNPATDKVIRTGDALFGSTLTDVSLGAGRRLNDHGDIVFHYALANGVTGIAAALLVSLPGDYNRDDTVDAADYVVWRKNVGTSNMLPNDLVGGMIGPAHYSQWRTDFGQSAGPGSGAGANVAVPEPAISLLLILAASGCCLRRCRAA